MIDESGAIEPDGLIRFVPPFSFGDFEYFIHEENWPDVKSKIVRFETVNLTTITFSFILIVSGVLIVTFNLVDRNGSGITNPDISLLFSICIAFQQVSLAIWGSRNRKYMNRISARVVPISVPSITSQAFWSLAARVLDCRPGWAVAVEILLFLTVSIAAKFAVVLHLLGYLDLSVQEESKNSAHSALSVMTFYSLMCAFMCVSWMRWFRFSSRR